MLGSDATLDGTIIGPLVNYEGGQGDLGALRLQSKNRAIARFDVTRAA
jgi:hypothetical protein